MKVNFKFFDYDSLENYSPGSFNAKYKTILEDKVEEPKDFDNKDTIYTPICPYCGGRNVDPIDPFYYKGSKGILTEARFLCLDEMCKCIF